MALAVVLTYIGSSCSKFNIDDGNLYSIKFNSLEKSLTKSIEDHESLLNNPPLDLLPQTVTMTTAHNEKYVCQLPSEESEEKNAKDEYDGPSVLKILEKVFIQSQCAYRLEHYWTYELCHGRHLRQYHEEREGKGIKTTEYFLGFYSKEKHEENKKIAEDSDFRKPLMKKIEAFNLPYYELIMNDGTICDLNGQPRVTRVHYVCYPTGKNEVYSLKESSTCEYEVVVLSPLLCNHPDYRPEETSERLINCKPANSQSATKPLNLIAMEAESLKFRSQKMFEADLSQGDKGPGSVRIEIKPVSFVEDDEEDLKNKDENWPETPQRQLPNKPLVDPKIVQDFLLGNYCLFGGTGWWRYEFCYGAKVNQYHEEKGSPKTVINLGKFNLQNHKDWLEANPSKRPKPIESRKHISHFYSNGDYCEISKKPRHVEVKLKCKPPKASESPSAVSIYLLEPKTCEYVLGVESSIVCDIIASADEDGLMSLTKADFNKVDVGMNPDSTKNIDEREYVKFTLEDAIISNVNINEEEEDEEEDPDQNE